MKDMARMSDGSQETNLVLTVEEAARLLRIGRSAGYELARRYLTTGGAEGLPVIRLGRLLRVPRHALERMLEGNSGSLIHEPQVASHGGHLLITGQR